MPSNAHLNTFRNWISFWTLGTINNFAYVVILCGASNLADSFNDGKLTGFVQWANVAVGVGVRMLNVYCLDAPTNARFYCVTLGFLVGYAVLASSVYFDFWLAITAIIAIGGACSFGESLMLGFMKNYPSSVTGGWASGTGMAGVGGSAYYLLLWLLLHDHLQFNCTDSLFVIFASLIPLTLLYVLVFMFGPTRPTGMKGGCSCTDKDDGGAHLTINGARNGMDESGGYGAGGNGNEGDESNESNESNNGNSGVSGSNNNTAMMMDAAALSDSSTSPLIARTTTAHEAYWGRICRLVRSVLSVSIHLGMVYFFEYVVSVAFAIHAPSFKVNNGWWCDHGYTVLQFCYQSGVLLSRSSLSFFRIKNIKIITMLQGLNFIGWYLNAQYHFLSIGMQVAWMFWVGCMGGAMYVNVFANLVDDETIHGNDRELSINLVAFSMNVGIVCSAIFQLVADNSFLSHDHACAVVLAAQCSSGGNGTNVTMMASSFFSK